VRENRTHGSEGGDGESRSRPLSVGGVETRPYIRIPGRATLDYDPGVARNDGMGKLSDDL
jgi:hypothetical protein